MPCTNIQTGIMAASAEGALPLEFARELSRSQALVNHFSTSAQVLGQAIREAVRQGGREPSPEWLLQVSFGFASAPPVLLRPSGGSGGSPPTTAIEGSLDVTLGGIVDDGETQESISLTGP